MNEEKLKQSIFETISYFDQFSYPLTREELYRFLWMPHAKDHISYEDFFIYVSDNHDPRILEKDGFFYIKNREHVITLRQGRIVTVEKKMKIAMRAIKILRMIPYVRSVFVCNTLAGHVPGENSDIDVFIIIKKGHMWYARFLSNVILKLVRMRTGKEMKDKICLSFFMSDSHLNMFALQLPKPDIYMMYWILQLIPVYDPDDLYRSIMRANIWVKEYIPHGIVSYQGSQRWTVQDTKRSLVIKNFLSRFFSTKKYEMRLKHIQHKRINQVYGHVGNLPDTRVIISDHILKFHENDRRQEFYDEWMKCIV